MSIISRRAESAPPAHRRVDAVATAKHARQTGSYLTDGVDLFRSLGAIAGGMGQMVGLENCRSLDVMLLPIGEVRARGLRAVVPAAGEPGSG
jgi:hypothetical protein